MNASEPPPLTPPNSTAPTPGGEHENQIPITHFAEAFEAVLRQPRRVIYQLTQPGAGALTARLAMVALLLILVYGVIVGTFSGGMQLWAAPLKIAIGLLVSALICLPSLYIFACLGGSRVRLSEVAGLVAGLTALMSVLLMGFAPVAWVFSQSTESVAVMGFLHIVFALIAVSFGLRLVRTGLASMGGAMPGNLRLWCLIFVFVLLQMTTALRPIVGTADTFLPAEKQFFLSHWLESLGKHETGTSTTLRE